MNTIKNKGGRPKVDPATRFSHTRPIRFNKSQIDFINSHGRSANAYVRDLINREMEKKVGENDNN